jgi:isoleucyl-tRNA synthetase
VGESKKDFLIRLQHVWSFFVIYANIDGWDPTEPEHAGAPIAERTIMDRWIISELHRTAQSAVRALDAYDILSGSRALFDFVDRLSNWYVRASRSRFWASGLELDKRNAYATLHEALSTLARMAAPFIPFFAEELHRSLVAGPWARRSGKGTAAAPPESVHLADYPEGDPALIDEDLSTRMAVALEVVSLGRSARVDAGIRVRQPLREAVLVLADPSISGRLADLLPLVQDELNVKTIRFTEDADRYVIYTLKPNFKLIGPRLGPLVQKVKGALQEADAAGLRAQIEDTGACRILAGGQEVSLSREEVEVGLTPREGYAARAARGIVLVLDTKLTDDLIREGWARELVAAVNGLRGELSLAYEARIRLEVWCNPELRGALEENIEYVRSETLSIAVKFHSLESPGGKLEGKAGTEAFRVAIELVD